MLFIVFEVSAMQGKYNKTIIKKIGITKKYL